MSKPEINEIWKDQDGTFYTPAVKRTNNGWEVKEFYWLAFGADKEILEGWDMLMNLPLVRVFDKDGNYLNE